MFFKMFFNFNSLHSPPTVTSPAPPLLPTHPTPLPPPGPPLPKPPLNTPPPPPFPKPNPHTSHHRPPPCRLVFSAPSFPPCLLQPHFTLPQQPPSLACACAHNGTHPRAQKHARANNARAGRGRVRVGAGGHARRERPARRAGLRTAGRAGSRDCEQVRGMGVGEGSGWVKEG